jgi:tRNA nucleotidyltransferase (CCA-adding enzyme)
MCDRSLSLLSPQTWPFSLELLPESAYMVGGAVRDALLKRHSAYLDLDFVVATESVKTAKKLANYYKAGFVVLDPQRQIARVVFAHATVDFAKQEGDSLETDLQRRDFTINAIAYNPHTGELIDPLQGYADLQAGVIKMVSAANLQDDPLRLLRAYRQAAQLGFTIEPQTQATIRQLAPLLGEIAAERVRVELGYLLSMSQGTPWLIAAYQDNLLSVWFPSVTTKKLEQLLAVENWAVELGKNWEKLGKKIQEKVSDTIKTSWLSLAKLACLVSSDPQQAEVELMNLRYSRAEIQSVTCALKFLQTIEAVTTGEMSLSEQYFFFLEAGKTFPAVAAFAIPERVPLKMISTLIERYLNPDDQVAHPTQLITGKELMQALNLPSGQQIGLLLTQIQLARIEGKISTLPEAIKLASQLI